MRIAVIPMATIRNIAGDSEFLTFYRFAKRLAELKDDVFFYFVVPMTQIENLPLNSKIKYIFEHPESGVYYNYYDQLVDVPATFLQTFNSRIGKYVVDAVFTSRTESAPILNRQLVDYRIGSVIPVVIDESKAADFGEGYGIKNPLMLMARCLGYALSYSIFGHEEERNIAVKVANRYLSPSSVRNIVEKSYSIGYGVDCDRLDILSKDVMKSEKFTVFFGGRMGVTKRADKVVEIYDKFFQFGRDVKIVVTSPKEEVWFGAALKTKFPEIEFYKNLSADDYVSKAKSGHVFVSGSKLEGFTVGVMEQLYMGLVGILPDLPWARGLIGERNKQYPYYYKNWDEAAAMLRFVYENYEKAKKAICWVPNYVKVRFGLDNEILRKFDVIENAVKDMSKNVNGLLGERSIELIERSLISLRGREVFSLDDIVEVVAENSDILEIKDILAPRRGRISKIAIYKYLIGNGFKDLCKREVPDFAKA